MLAVVGAVLIGSVLGWLLFGDHGSGSTAPPRGKLIELSLRRGIYPPLGLELAQPTSWLSSLQPGLVQLASPDAGGASVTIADIAPAGNDAKLRPQLTSQLMRTFRPAQASNPEAVRIGNLPALVTGIFGTAGRTKAGRTKGKILILTTAISSHYRTYSIQVLYRSPHPSPQSELEVRNILGSVRFSAPTG